MKKRLVKLSFLFLMIGMILFTSCKHDGHIVKNGLVQITVTVEEQSNIIEIPVNLYDSIKDKFTEISSLYNSDTILSEDVLDEYYNYSANLYTLDISNITDSFEQWTKNIAEVVPEKNVEKVIKKLSELDEEGKEKLGAVCELISEFFDVPYYYLKNIAEVERGNGWYDTKEEVLESLRLDQDYKCFMVVMPQIFPGITFNEK